MKKQTEKSKDGVSGTGKQKAIVKGTGRAVVISVLVHAGLFLLAGMLVVFTVIKKEEQVFEPPKAAERPKMKLKKPKVRVKKSSRPKSTARITSSRAAKTAMPSIDLPSMGGLGDGLGDGIGGFDIMPEFTGISLFGSKITAGNELEGYFYNFNRDRGGRKKPMDPDTMYNVLVSFMKSGWNISKLTSYYRSPEALYTPTICIPTVQAELAPLAFGMKDAEGYGWGVLYEGTLVYPEDITFRFWGVGDKIMAVNVEGKTILVCAYHRAIRQQFATIWNTTHPQDNTYYFGEHRARPSDWITLKAGEKKDIKIFLGDPKGGLVYHILSVEVEGEEYPMTRGGGGPTFPVFKTGVLSRDLRDQIYDNLYFGDTCLTNGPVFNDFASNTNPESEPVAAVEPVKAAEVPDEDGKPQMRTWMKADGEKITAKFQTLMGKKVILEDATRKQLKLSLDQLSPEDQEYVEFAAPPEFDIEFSSKSKQLQNPPVSPWVGQNQRPLQMFEYTFGTRVKQASVGEYNRAVTLEYFAVGEEIDGDNYVLLDRMTSSFTPSRENRKSHEFYGEPVELIRIAYRSSAPMRGTKYSGYLILIRDERGKIIQHKASNAFLYENRKNLNQLKPKNHFNRECLRVIPARPNEDNRGPGAVRGN